MYLADFHEEVAPFPVVEGEQAAFLRFLRDSQVAETVRVGPSLEVAEVGFREKLPVALRFLLEAFPHEDVLFVDGISFTQRQSQGRKQVREVIEAVDVRRILLYRVLDLQDG